jgi:N-sulfoglucosamine sulfohydrolase
MSPKGLNRRTFLRSASWAATSLLPKFAFGASNPRPPNFVIFLSDDHGLFDTGCYGNDAIKTPNIDALASQGMRFKSMYTPTSICVPSRSALFTGLWPIHNGAINNRDKVRPGLVSLFGHFNRLGYRTALAGKVHVSPRSAFPFEEVREWKTTEYLQAHADEPFCYVYCCKQPHRPYPESPRTKPEDVLIPPYLIDTPATRKALAGYYDLVEMMDAKLGRVLGALDELDLARNTVVMYLSDHGTAVPFAKFSLYEAGIHVPCAVRFPGRIHPGSASDALVSFVDVIPTLIDLAGGAIPNNIDGRSFRSVLEGRSDSHREKIFGSVDIQERKGVAANRIRSLFDGRYKYIANPDFEVPIATPFNTRRGGGYGAMYRSWQKRARRDENVARRVALYVQRPPEELYDLSTDPHELINLAGDWTQMVRMMMMRRELAAWMEKIGDPISARL